jgi:hypothetical protein
MRPRASFEPASLDDDQRRAVGALRDALDAVARRAGADVPLARACSEVVAAYGRALAGASGPDDAAWRRFYELSVYVVARAGEGADTSVLRSFVGENEDLARDSAA